MFESASTCISPKELHAIFDIAATNEGSFYSLAPILDKYSLDVLGPLFRGLQLPRFQVREGTLISCWRNPGVSHWSAKESVAESFSKADISEEVLSSFDFVKDESFLPFGVNDFLSNSYDASDNYFVPVVLVLSDVPPAIPLYSLLQEICADEELYEMFQQLSESSLSVISAPIEGLISEKEITLLGYDFEITGIQKTADGVYFADVVAVASY